MVVWRGKRVGGKERDVALGRRESGCVNYGESERVDKELKGCLERRESGWGGERCSIREEKKWMCKLWRE